ncbi:MAG TPA: gluconeogenesis factor YvcK family protein [Clostridia bacterium]|nr:gluconeogenesis factor YvcK family protein [Clostridia bacterium]
MKIVIIGGGTGLSVLLQGLKKITKNLSAVVNMVDDGGSSGILRSDLGMLPPGDLRSCILSMSNTTELLEEVLNYRFDKGSLSGQSLGNLIMAALSDLTGGIDNALGACADLFNITGKVYAVTLDNIDLVAELKDGTKVLGESKIPLAVIENGSPIHKVNLYPERPRAYRKVIEVIEEADLILVGPGSLYTSILPALLVSGVKEAILRSSGKCVYVANVMTQPGETDHMSVSDHVRAIYDHIEDAIFDGILVSSTPLSPQDKKAYEDQGASPLFCHREDIEYLDKMGVKIIEDQFTQIVQGYIRHDADKVSRALIDYVMGITFYVEA